MHIIEKTYWAGVAGVCLSLSIFVVYASGQIVDQMQNPRTALIERADEVAKSNISHACKVSIDGIERNAKCASESDRFTFVFTGDNFRLYSYPMVDNSPLLAARIDRELKVMDRSILEYFSSKGNDRNTQE